MKDPHPLHYHLPKCKSCGATNSSYAWEVVKDEKKRKVSSVYFSVDNIPQKCLNECEKVFKVEEKVVPVFKVPKIDTEFVESQEFNEDNYLADVNSFSSENQTVIEQPNLDTALDLKKDVSNTQLDTVHQNTPESSPRSGGCEIQKVNEIDNEVFVVKSSLNDIFRAECVEITNAENNTSGEGEYHSFSDDYEEGIYDSPVRELVEKDIRDYSVPIDFYCEDYFRKEGVRSPRKTTAKREPKIVLEPILEESKNSSDDSGLSCIVTEKSVEGIEDQTADQENEKKCIDTDVIETEEYLPEVNVEKPQILSPKKKNVYTKRTILTEIKEIVEDNKEVQDMNEKNGKNIMKYDDEVDVFKSDNNVKIKTKTEVTDVDALDENARRKHLFICTVYDDTSFSKKIEDTNEIIKNILNEIITKVEAAAELKLEIFNCSTEKTSSMVLAAKYLLNCCNNSHDNNSYITQDIDCDKTSCEMKSFTNSVQTAMDVYTESETYVSEQQDLFNSMCKNIFEILSDDACTKQDDASVGDIFISSDANTEQVDVSDDGVLEKPTENLKFTRKSSVESTLSSVCAKSFDSVVEFEKFEEISEVITNILDKIDYQYDNNIFIKAPKLKGFNIFGVKTQDISIVKNNDNTGQDKELEKYQIDTNKQNSNAPQHDGTISLDTDVSKLIQEEIISHININQIPNSENHEHCKTQISSPDFEVYEIPKQSVGKPPVLDLKTETSCNYFSKSDAPTASSKNTIDISGNEPKLLKNIFKSTLNDEESFVVQTESQSYFDCSDSKTYSRTELLQDDFSIAKIIQDLEFNDFNESLVTETSESNLESTKIVEAILYYIFDEAFFVLGKKIKTAKRKKVKKVITVADMEDILLTAKPLWSDCDLHNKCINVNASEDVKVNDNDVSFLFEENFAKDDDILNEEPVTFEIKILDHIIKNSRLKSTSECFVEFNEEIKQVKTFDNNVMSVDIEKQSERESTVHKNDTPKKDVKSLVNEKITCTILEEIDITNTPFKKYDLGTNQMLDFNKAERYLEENVDFCETVNFNDLNKSFIENIKKNIEEETSGSYDTVNSHVQAIFNKDDTGDENLTCNMQSNLNVAIDVKTEATFVENDSTETASEILQYILDKSSNNIFCNKHKENAKRGAKVENVLNESFVLEKTTEDMNTAFVEDTQFYSRSSSPNRKTSVFQYCSVSPIRNPSDTFVGEDLSVLYEKDDTIMGSPFVKRASVISMSQIEHSGGVKYWISFDDSVEGEPVKEGPKRLFDENKIPSFVTVDFKTNKHDKKMKAFDKDTCNARRESVLLQEFDNTECYLEGYRQTNSYERFFDDIKTNLYTNENNLQKENNLTYFERKTDRFYSPEKNLDNFYISDIYQDNTDFPETSRDNQPGLYICNQSENSVEKCNHPSATTVQDSFVTACASTDYTTCESNNNTHFEAPHKKLLYDSRIDLHTKVHRRQYTSWPPFEDTLFYRIISKFRMSESFDPSELESSKINSSF